MPFTTPTTAVPGAAITAAIWNTGVRDNMTILWTPPSCRAYHNAAQSIATGVATVLALNSERWDTDAMHDTATNNSRVTAKTAGRYFVEGSAEFASNATGLRELYLRVNGTTAIAADVRTAVNGLTTAFTIQTYWDFAVNDYVELVAFQNTGAALNVLSTSAYSPELMMVRTG